MLPIEFEAVRIRVRVMVVEVEIRSSKNMVPNAVFQGGQYIDDV